SAAKSKARCESVTPVRSVRTSRDESESVQRQTVDPGGAAWKQSVVGEAAICKQTAGGAFAVSQRVCCSQFCGSPFTPSIQLDGFSVQRSGSPVIPIANCSDLLS